MPFFNTAFPGLVIFQPVIFHDERGYFCETYNEKSFQLNGIQAHFVQDNESKSKYGVVRGLHFQKGDAAQAKLVRASEGTVIDIVVDIRKGSPTYGKYFSIELSNENHLQFFVPRGFAHGFVVVSQTAVFNYKCDNFYNKEADGGIQILDPSLDIEIPVDKNKIFFSEKDSNQPLLAETDHGFIYNADEYKNWQADEIPSTFSIQSSI